MQIFFYYIKGIPTLEEFTDRKLIAKIISYSKEDGELSLSFQKEDITNLGLLRPRICCALRFDPENGTESTYDYFYLDSFDVSTSGEDLSLIARVEYVMPL